MSSDLGLGKIIRGDPPRDAIHIAVAPVIADEDLQPGMRVRLRSTDSGYALRANGDDAVGIVDPFLRVPVRRNQKFWLWLNPNTITALRHQWTHPEFDRESHYWMADFAVQADLPVEQLIAAAHSYLDSGEYISEGGKWEGFNTPDEFWDHFQNITGRAVKSAQRNSFFSCSC